MQNVIIGVIVVLAVLYIVGLCIDRNDQKKKEEIKERCKLQAKEYYSHKVVQEALYKLERCMPFSMRCNQKEYTDQTAVCGFQMLTDRILFYDQFVLDTNYKDQYVFTNEACSIVFSKIGFNDIDYEKQCVLMHAIRDKFEEALQAKFKDKLSLRCLDGLKWHGHFRSELGDKVREALGMTFVIVVCGIGLKDI